MSSKKEEANTFKIILSRLGFLVQAADAWKYLMLSNKPVYIYGYKWWSSSERGLEASPFRTEKDYTSWNWRWVEKWWWGEEGREQEKNSMVLNERMGTPSAQSAIYISNPESG